MPAARPTSTAGSGRIGWATAREVEIVHGRIAWLDRPARLRQRNGEALVIEVKTRLDDLGALERQIAWYERHGLRKRRAGSAGGRPAWCRRVWPSPATRSSASFERIAISVDRLPRAARRHSGSDLSTRGADPGAWLRADRPVEPASRLADPDFGRWPPISPAYADYADAARPAAASIAARPADTNEPSEPSPMNRKPRSSSGGQRRRRRRSGCPPPCRAPGTPRRPRAARPGRRARRTGRGCRGCATGRPGRRTARRPRRAPRSRRRPRDRPATRSGRCRRSAH